MDESLRVFYCFLEKKKENFLTSFFPYFKRKMPAEKQNRLKNTVLRLKTGIATGV